MNPKNHTRWEQLYAPKAITNNATQTMNWDTQQNGSYATIIVAMGSEANTNGVGPTISLLQSDDTVVTNFATVVADQSAVDLVAARNLIYNVDLRGKKRYLRLSISTGTATNDHIVASVTAGGHHLGLGAASTSDMVGSTNDIVVEA